MTQYTKRKSSDKGFLAKFWNEFLFAREFEYETPLTPDEVAETLKNIEGQTHRHYFLSLSQLKHKFTYTSLSDKSGEFAIELETSTRDKWWDYDSAMLETSGTITADADTGMTVVKGSTYFNRHYYLLMLVIFLPNFWINSFDGYLPLQLFWLSFVVFFWYVMYGQRNKLADEIDTLIMNAKATKQEDYSRLQAEQDETQHIALNSTQHDVKSSTSFSS